MSHISKRILEYIEQHNVHAHPTWWFVTQNILYWLCFLLFALLGGKVIGLILYELTSVDLPFVMEAHDTSLGWIFLATLTWVVFLVFFTYISLYFFRKTKHGYQYRIGLVLVGNITISLIAGNIFLVSGISESTDEVLNVMVPPYQNMREMREEIWSHPEQGKLAGRIVSVRENDSFLLEDMRRNPWTVNSSEAKRTFGTRIEPGFEVKIIGNTSEAGVFFAKRIAPLHPFNHKPPSGNHLRPQDGKPKMSPLVPPRENIPYPPEQPNPSR